MKRNGFTLTELLVTTAIIAILSAILFPVFARSADGARRVVCLSNLRSSILASSLYQNDYDDRFVLSNYKPAGFDSRTDRTWVQLVLPYAKDFDIFRCPSDTGQRPKQEALFDEDLVPGEAITRYYRASQLSNIGYNYLYLAPVQKLGSNYNSVVRSSSDIVSPSRTIQYVDTVHDVKSGSPTGGGNYLVIPPCRLEIAGSTVLDSFFGTERIQEIYTPSNGWTSAPNTPYQFGSAWPWHTDKVNIVYTDGHAEVAAINQLTEGCETKPNWEGYITNSSKYKWALVSNP